MEFIQNRTAPDELWFCPIFNRKIDEGLCWEVSNIGDDSLGLHGDEYPPCGWAEAHKICDKCQHYADWGA